MTSRNFGHFLTPSPIITLLITEAFLVMLSQNPWSHLWTTPYSISSSRSSSKSVSCLGDFHHHQLHHQNTNKEVRKTVMWHSSKWQVWCQIVKKINYKWQDWTSLPCNEFENNFEPCHFELCHRNKFWTLWFQICTLLLKNTDASKFRWLFSSEKVLHAFHRPMQHFLLSSI